MVGLNAAANRVAVMAATDTGQGRRTGETVGVGSAQETSVTGSDGHEFVYAIGSKDILAVVMLAGTNIGLLQMETRNTDRNITTL